MFIAGNQNSLKNKARLRQFWIKMYIKLVSYSQINYLV